MPTVLERLRTALAPTYEVERELGSGGMGTVFLARDPNLDRQVAIKILRPDLVSDVASERFQREARVLARLKHPNIVPVYQAGTAGDFSYYVMEYFGGETLEERLGHGALSTEETLDLADGLLCALAAAHENGIVHRDVKPANVFLVDGRAVLGDFGIATSTGQSGERLTGSGQRVGTPPYMPPEQFVGDSVTAATDVYAAGAVIYEACTGRRWSILTSTDDVDWLEVPDLLEEPIRIALAWSPGDRWPDAATFRRALVEGETATVNTASLKQSKRPAFSWTLGLAGLALVAAAAIGIAGMTPGGFSLFTYAGAWLTVMAGIWFLFEKAEEAVSPDVRGAVARWLRNLDPAGSVQTWPTTFGKVFDRIFGARHLSLLCFWRSCIASFVAVIIVSVLYAALTSGVLFESSIHLSRIFWVQFAVLNLIPDYLSLLETRYLLRWMGNRSTRKSVAGLLALDSFVTAAIALVAIPVALALTIEMGTRGMGLTDVPEYVFRFLVEETPYVLGAIFSLERVGLFYFRDGLPLPLTAPLAIFFYSTFLTSIWIWLYLLAGGAVRVANYAGVWVARFNRVFDIDSQPLRSIGSAAMFLVTLIFLLALPLAAS